MQIRFELADFEASYGTAEQLPASDLPEIAFAGRSNVGKSSLLNRLFQRKALARVSNTPGKTATVNFYRVQEARFVDLPGYGYARVSESEKKRWSDLMEGYFTSGRDIRLVVQLLDMRHPSTQDDRNMIEYLLQAGMPFILVLTKRDKLNKTQHQARLDAFHAEFSGYPILPFSALNGEGAQAIQEKITGILG